MNLAPIYELRSRLRTAMIAGTNLIPEDFRLKRAAEDMKPLEALSPVFAKIGQLTDRLLSQECVDREGTLMDAISLVDALLCTQGQVAVEGELEPIATSSWGSVITNAPYSVVKTLVEALTTSGNGHYQFVIDTHKERPELFRDYRVKSAMVAALGASYAELAEQVTVWLKGESQDIVPLLQKDFDPKGKKEMIRRVHVMEAVAGERCNDFFVRMIPEAEKDVKNELIYALRHNAENVDFLLELVKKEKGNAKKMAYFALAAIEDERAEKLFCEMYAKKPIDTMLYLSMTHAKWAAKLVGKSLVEQLEICKEPCYGKWDRVFTPNDTEVLRATIEALPGKKGPEICEAFRAAYEVDDIYYKKPNDDKVQTWEMHVTRRRYGVRLEAKRMVGAMAYFLEAAILLNPDADLCALAEELYRKKSGNNKGVNYFPAALAAKLVSGENCGEWLKDQLFSKGFWGVKKNEALKGYLAHALEGLIYDESRGGYVLQTPMQDAANDATHIYEQPVSQDIAGVFTDVLIEYADRDVDREMIHFINPENKELCKKLEEHFYKKARTGEVENRRIYWPALVKCGCERCEGLLVSYVQKNTNISYYDLNSRLWELPGNLEAIEKEAEAVCKMIKDGKVKIRNWNEQNFKIYVRNFMETKGSKL